MKINKTAVKKIANLAYLNTNDKDIEAYQEALNKILTIFEELKEIDTTEVEPMTNTIGDTLTLYADEVEKGNSKKEVMANALHTKCGFYSVPKIIE
jgi:aspartyl-tRNA(Asn)/glutamyl-tRNA(Gln) amidotransferase subunit C